MLRAYLARVVAAEDGAVTVDWVALTGAIVGLGILVLLQVAQGATGTAAGIGTQLNAVEIPGVTFALPSSDGGASTGGISSGSMAP